MYGIVYDVASALKVPEKSLPPDDIDIKYQGRDLDVKQTHITQWQFFRQEKAIQMLPPIDSSAFVWIDIAHPPGFTFRARKSSHRYQGRETVASKEFTSTSRYSTGTIGNREQRRDFRPHEQI